MGSKANPGQLSATDQVEVLRDLRQAAAAYLLDCRPRTLRDAIDAPRSGDGRYDAQQLVKWAAGRMERRELPDRDLESLLLAAEAIAVAVPSSTGLRIVNILGELRERYGDAGLLVFVDLLLAELTRLAEDHRPPSPEEVEREKLAARRREENARAAEELRITVVCESCERLRQGRKWAKGRIPADHVPCFDRCPDCEAKEPAS